MTKQHHTGMALIAGFKVAKGVLLLLVGCISHSHLDQPLSSLRILRGRRADYDSADRSAPPESCHCALPCHTVETSRPAFTPRPAAHRATLKWRQATF